MEDDSSSDSDPEAARLVFSQKFSDAADSDDSGLAMKGSMQPLPVARASGSDFSCSAESSGQPEFANFDEAHPALMVPSSEPSCFAPGVIDSEAVCLKYGCAKDPLFEQITLDLAGEADEPAGFGSSIV